MMKKKLFLHLLSSLAVCSLFFTSIYLMESDSSSDDDIFSLFVFNEEDVFEYLDAKKDNDIQSHEQQLNLTIEQIFKLSEEELKKMSQENLRTISTQVCQYVKKVMCTVSKDIEISLVNDLKEYFETLEKLQKNTRALIDPKVLLVIIEKLPGIITSIENALEDVERQLEKETQEDQLKMPELYGDTSPLKVKRDRLKCLLTVLKPSFVVLVGGVVVAYNMGWFPTTISETVQNYVFSTCKSWFF